MDVRVNAEAPQSPTHAETRREDYRPPEWLVPEIALNFTLGIDKAKVQSKLMVERNGGHDRPLRLNGDELQPLGVWIDGTASDGWSMDGDSTRSPSS